MDSSSYSHTVMLSAIPNSVLQCQVLTAAFPTLADCFSRSICLYTMKLWQKMPNRIMTTISKDGNATEHYEKSVVTEHISTMEPGKDSKVIFL